MIERKYIPKYLYYYDRMKGNTSKIFLDDLIRFSSPLSFNDPFDCRNPITFDGTKKEQLKYVEGFLGNMNRSKRKAIAKNLIKEENLNKLGRDTQEKILNDISVLCLSSKYDDILMFSHYADKHKGFCLQFECRKDANFKTAKKVCYSRSNSYPELNRFKSSNDKLLKGSLLVKSKQWQYENEYRVIIAEAEGLKQFEGECLTGVIFGCQMEKNNKNLIEGWIKKRKFPVNIYNVSRNNKFYALDFDPRKPE